MGENQVPVSDQEQQDLTGSDLWAANLVNADLSGANLTKADLYGAGVSIDAAGSDTICPDGINSNAHGDSCANRLTSVPVAFPTVNSVNVTFGDPAGTRTSSW